MTSETAKESTGRATFTIKETAVILRIGKNSAYQAARRGELPVVKIGGRLLVPPVRRLNAFC
jgi:excisionase family DNA binding protein